MRATGSLARMVNIAKPSMPRAASKAASARLTATGPVPVPCGCQALRRPMSPEERLFRMPEENPW
jgi:hypothetical protein